MRHTSATLVAALTPPSLARTAAEKRASLALGSGLCRAKESSIVGKKLLAVAVMAVLGAGLMASPALGRKKCPKLCKTVIASCRQCCHGGFSDSPPRVQRECKHNCTRNILRACRLSPDTAICGDPSDIGIVDDCCSFPVPLIQELCASLEPAGLLDDAQGH